MIKIKRISQEESIERAFRGIGVLFGLGTRHFWIDGADARIAATKELGWAVKQNRKRTHGRIGTVLSDQ